MTFILGLTGSIGMGKSTTAGLFKNRGIPVYDADLTVHDLYRGRLVPEIEKAFPGSTTEQGVDRTRLGALVIGKPDQMQRLESIVHPAVQAEQDQFVARHFAEPIIVLDIPLLFENKKDQFCDAVVVVSTDPVTQRKRVLARPDMTVEKLDALLARQIPDEDKRRRAQFIIDTGHDIAHADRQVASLLKALSGRM